MLYSSVVSLVLLQIVYTEPYRDYLPHTALDKVPAVLGAPVQIRCTKIIEKSSYDYIETADCNGYRGTSCRHVWTRNGKELSSSGKYSMKSSLTFDYCETFEWTTDIVKNMHIEAAEGGDYYRDRDMKCFASALVIANVTEHDLGEYQCRLVSGEEEHGEHAGYNVQNITIFDSASPVKLPKKIEYFENFYTKGIRSKLLMQCVVTGGPVHWFVRFDTKECSRWEEGGYDHDSRNYNCVNETIQPIEEISKIDGWHCFNHTIDKHNPYGMDQVTESFIYFQNICALDWAGIYCSADSEGTVRSAVGELVIKDQWSEWDGDYYSWWRVEDAIYALGYVMLPIIVSIFFIVGATIACVRGKVCNCCGGQSLPYRYTSVNPVPQTMTYIVAPPQAQGNLAPQGN